MERKNTPGTGLSIKPENYADEWYRLSSGQAGGARRAVVIARAKPIDKHVRLARQHPSISFIALDGATLRKNLTALFVDYCDQVRFNLAKGGDVVPNYELSPVYMGKIHSGLKKAVDIHQHVDIIGLQRGAKVSMSDLLSSLREDGYRHIDFHICRYAKMATIK